MRLSGPIPAMLVAALFLATVAALFWDSYPPDLASVYYAAELFGQGEIVYWGHDAAPPTAWAEAMARDGFGDAFAFPFLYAPLWAWALAPVADVIDAQLFFNLAQILNAAAILLAALAARRLFGAPIPAAAWLALTALLCLLTVPGLAQFHFNQPQVWVSLAMIVAVERLAAGQRLAPALLIALAASIKIYPAVLGLLFLARRDWAGAALTVVFGAGLLALSVWAAGPQMHHAYLATLAETGSRISITPNAMSLEATLTKLWLAATAWPEASHIAKPPLVALITLTVFAATLVWLFRRPMADAGYLRGGLGAAFLILITLFAPVAWANYFLIAICLAPGVFAFLPTRRALVTLALFGGLLSQFAYPALTRLAEAPVGVPLTATLAYLMLVVIFVRGRRQLTPPE